MEYEEALSYLNSVVGENQKLSIETIARIVDCFPFNLKKINFLQVAGTNGKGSVAYFLHSILKKLDQRCGLFISPHLCDVRERISSGNDLIAKADFADAACYIKDLCQKLFAKKVISGMPTFFEHLFLMALYYFYHQQSRFAVLEVGLGGRLDATSTVFSSVGVITKIALDHQNILGNSIYQIAAEKAGIMKPGMVVVTGVKKDSRVAAVLEENAAQKRSRLVYAFDENNFIRREKKNFIYSSQNIEYQLNLRMSGAHQAVNAAIAIKAIEELQKIKKIAIEKAEIEESIATVLVPGRQEVVRHEPLLILDVAHNPDGIRELIKLLKSYKIRDGLLVFGVLADKNYRSMVKGLRPFFNEVVLLNPLSDRALPREKLLELFADKKIVLPESYQQAAEIINCTNKPAVVCGSFFLVGNMRKLIIGGKNGSESI